MQRKVEANADAYHLSNGAVSNQLTDVWNGRVCWGWH
jgi:hypothetical protein